MKKTLTVLMFAALCSANAFASYIVVLKDGTRYAAKQKYTIANGKALVQLKTGGSLALDPALIDVAKSEQATKAGESASASALNLNAAPIPQQEAPQAPSLGSQIKLRKPAAQQAAEAAARPAPVAAVPTPAPTGPGMSPEVIDKFERAYENVGIFEHKLTSTGATLRAELTADNEDKVFNAISATSFLMVRNAGVEGARIDTVELFMKTTTGGSSGRFLMSRADAEALDKKTITQQDYFVRKVIY